MWRFVGRLGMGLVALALLQSVALAEDLAVFDLSLFGYQVGMSFDQATSVRPFVRVVDRADHVGESCGYVDHLWIDDVELELQVCFVEDQVYKVIGKFSPALIEDLVKRLRPVLGKGENESMLLQVPDGGQVSNRIQKWHFPGIQVVLVGSSRNTEFATLSMVSKLQRDTPEKVAPPMDEPL